MENSYKIIAYVIYQIAPLPMTFSNPEGHFSYYKHFKIQYFGRYSI